MTVILPVGVQLSETVTVAGFAGGIGAPQVNPATGAGHVTVGGILSAA
jgi:hypothetical protein